nr:MAG TPA: hypothetical protein [Caudoviricetes sp.]
MRFILHKWKRLGFVRKSLYALYINYFDQKQWVTVDFRLVVI